MTTPRSRGRADRRAEPDLAEPQGLQAQPEPARRAELAGRAPLEQVAARAPPEPLAQRVPPEQPVQPVQRVVAARHLMLVLMRPTRLVTRPSRSYPRSRRFEGGARPSRSRSQRAGALSSTCYDNDSSTLNAPALAAIGFGAGQFHVAATLCE